MTDQMDGTGIDDGQTNAQGLQPTEPDAEHGQPTDEGTKREPEGVEGRFDGMTPEQLHKSYKELQTEFGKRNELSKQLEAKFAPFGGVDQLLGTVNTLVSDADFVKWYKAKSEGMPNIEGLDANDPEVRKAFNAIKTMASMEVKRELEARVRPLEDALKEKNILSHFSEMDKQYGADWRQFEETISELSYNLPEKIQNNPTFEDIEDLYIKALRKNGKFDEFVSKRYAKMVEGKKSKATDKPSTTPGAAKHARATSIDEAFAIAKRIHGIT